MQQQVVLPDSLGRSRQIGTKLEEGGQQQCKSRATKAILKPGGSGQFKSDGLLPLLLLLLIETLNWPLECASHLAIKVGRLP